MIVNYLLLNKVLKIKKIDAKTFLFFRWYCTVVTLKKTSHIQMLDRLRTCVRETRNESIAVELDALREHIEKNLESSPKENLPIYAIADVLETFIADQADTCGYVHDDDRESELTFSELLDDALLDHRTLRRLECKKLQFIHCQLMAMTDLGGNTTRAEKNLLQALEDESAVRSGKQTVNDLSKWQIKKIPAKEDVPLKECHGIQLRTLDMLF